MGYAARLNPTARHFTTPAGVEKNRQARAEAECAAADRRRAEFDALVAAVEAPDALQRFGVGRLNAAKAFLAKRLGSEPARG
jgi:hypothetical protein